MNGFVLEEAVCCRWARWWWVCGVGANDSIIALPPSPIVSEGRLFFAVPRVEFADVSISLLSQWMEF